MHKTIEEAINKIYQAENVTIKSVEFLKIFAQYNVAKISVDIIYKTKHSAKLKHHSNIKKPFIDVISIDDFDGAYNHEYKSKLYHKLCDKDYIVITGDTIIKRYLNKRTNKYFIDFPFYLKNKSPYGKNFIELIKDLYERDPSITYLQETLFLEFKIKISKPTLYLLIKPN